MKNIQLETLLFLAKHLVITLRTSTLKLSYIYDIGKNQYQDIVEYLEENNEVSTSELDILNKYKFIFHISSDDIFSLDCILIDIKEGKRHWQKPEISGLTKLLENQLISEDESVRYLAHYNYYQEVIEVCEEKPELLKLAKKYGSERTRISLNNYEIMKVLDARLKPLGKKEKREKI